MSGTEWECNDGWMANGVHVGEGWWLAEAGDPTPCIMCIDRSYTIRMDNMVNEPLNPILAGPFDSREAAKAAYLMLYDVE